MVIRCLYLQVLSLLDPSSLPRGIVGYRWWEFHSNYGSGRFRFCEKQKSAGPLNVGEMAASIYIRTEEARFGIMSG
jgi:hypothetical protein